VTPHDHPPARRALEGALLFGVVMGAYMLVGHGTTHATRTPPWVTHLDTTIPFTPHAVWPYLGFYFGNFVITGLHVREARVFRATVVAFACMSAMAFPFFLLLPAAYPRPVVDPATGLSATAVTILQAQDPPTNTFPSLHVANSILCAAALRRSGHPAWRGSAVLSGCVALSVLLLKQHWLADVLAGGVLGIVVASLLARVHGRGAQ
jgi:membrane-associated phospholipid phosphatase